MPDTQTYDITILGAGPTGLFAAFCAGMREMTVKVIEQLPEPGGQLAVLYPDKYIFDAPGHKRILAKDLVRELFDQAHTFHKPAFCFEERARGLAQEGDCFVLTTDRGRHRSRAVLVAAGIGAFSPNKLAIPGAEEGKPGIHYFVKDTRFFRGKNVLIVGGGDSAADWALSLSDVARSVTVVHRRDTFRAHESSVKQLMQSTDVRTFHELRCVQGAARVEGATIFNNKTGAESQLDVDEIVFALGFKADLGDLTSWNIEMVDNQRHIRVDPRMSTNIPGVYAAGDVTEVTYLQKQELPQSQLLDESSLSIPSPKYVERQERWGLIVTGYAQAAVAVNHAKQLVTPKAGLFPGHSSAMRS